MTFVALSIAVRWVLGIWFALLIGWIALQMVRGGILVRGLLREHVGDSFDFYRIQHLAIVLTFCGSYAATALGAKLDPAALAAGHVPSLPDIPPVVLAAVLGSHATFVGVKFFNHHLRGGKP